jgi:hypothetical protein
MGKSVEHFWHSAQVAEPASDRRPGQRPAQRRGHAGTRRAVPQPEPGRNPGGALQSGRRANRPALRRRAEFAITGFRNRDLQAKLFDTAPRNDREARRRTHRTSRLIAKMRGHRLIAKVGKSRLYRVTARGIKATPSAFVKTISRSISKDSPAPAAETSAIVSIL